MFNVNESSVDRAIRIVAGLLVLSLFFIYPNASWRYFALLGIVPLLTGLVGTCPIYSIFGISTCPIKKT